MALTLADLRTFALEIASPDPSSAAADREVSHWINQALQRIASEHTWQHFVSTGKIYQPPAETGSAMDLTLGSRVVTLTGEIFEQKYLDDLWSLHVTGESRVSFELAEIMSPTMARLAEGDEWANATSAGTAYTWSRHRFDLPDDAMRVIRVEDAQTYHQMTGLLPHEFDAMRQLTPTQRAQATHYTVRGSMLEVWPSSPASARILRLTYVRFPPRFTTGSDGGAVIDWPAQWSDLLYKAISLEASITQGKHAPIPYALAKSEFEERLKVVKGEDSGVRDISGPMRLGRLRMGRDRYRAANYPQDLA